jgi:hypothetical protein
VRNNDKQVRISSISNSGKYVIIGLRVITGLFAVVGADGVVPVGLPAVTFPEEEGGWGKEGVIV